MASRSVLAAGRHHLRDTGMGYGAHLMRASRIGTRLIGAGGACIVHGLLPGLFADKASKTIVKLNEEIKHGPAHGGGEPFLLEFEI